MCIASGPSVTLEQLEVIRAARERDAVRVIVVNDMYLVAPWADVLYFADHKWWLWHVAGLEKGWPWVKFSSQEVAAAFRDFKGQKVTIRHQPMASGPDIYALGNAQMPEGMSRNPREIATGGNSGHQALNIAALSGGNPILLVGYDMKFIGRKSHSHNGHPTGGQCGEETYAAFAKRFSQAEVPLKQMGLRVVNCTPGSMIKSFPEGNLEEELGGVALSAYNGFTPLWTQVAENLWFGGTPEADPERYGRFKYIVDCVGNGPKFRKGWDSAILSAPFADASPPPPVEFVKTLADFAVAGMKQGFTLIHCQQGHNRSGLIAAAALVRAGLRHKLEVVQYLRQKRKPEVLTNTAFAKLVESL